MPVDGADIADASAPTLPTAAAYHVFRSPLLARGQWLVVETCPVTYDVTYERLGVLPLQR